MILDAHGCAPCHRCGADESNEPVQHDAPCGLPCMAGGVRGREGIAAFKAGQVHGKACPRCGTKGST